MGLVNNNGCQAARELFCTCCCIDWTPYRVVDGSMRSQLVESGVMPLSACERKQENIGMERSGEQDVCIRSSLRLMLRIYIFS